MVGDGDGCRDPTRPAQTAPHTGTVVNDLCSVRRLPAGDVFGDTLDVRTVGMVLGHAKSDGDVSASYVPDKERLRALRPVYETRERELQRLVGGNRDRFPGASNQRAADDSGSGGGDASGRRHRPRLGCGDPGRSRIGVGRPTEVIHLRRHRRAAARSPAALGTVSSAAALSVMSPSP